MEIKELNEQVEGLSKLRQIKNKIEEEIKAKQVKFEESIAKEVESLAGIKNEVRTAQDNILDALKENELKQWKHANLTISRKSRTKYDIVDEVALIADLKKARLAKEYVVETVIPQVTSLFAEKDFAGVEKVETEYVSVLTAKENNNDKK